MREPQSDNVYIESLRCLGISDWEMRFVQVHVTSLHAHDLRAHAIRAFGSWQFGRLYPRKEISAVGPPISGEMICSPLESFSWADGIKRRENSLVREMARHMIGLCCVAIWLQKIRYGFGTESAA